MIPERIFVKFDDPNSPFVITGGATFEYDNPKDTKYKEYVRSPEWESVEDRLPDEGYCLAWVDLKAISMHPVGLMKLYYHADKKRFDTADAKYKDLFVTHWMPLPAPPEDE